MENTISAPSVCSCSIFHEFFERSACPGFDSVCLEFLMTVTPLTNTKGIPSA